MGKRRGNPSYTWDARGKRWRRDGRYCAAPKASQLAKDKAGRPLDASGRRVPASALAAPARKAKRPSKAAKKPKATKAAKPKKPQKPKKAKKPAWRPIADYLRKPRYTWDGRRWRRDGKWSGPPRPEDLGRDDRGRYVDATGKTVPRAALPLHLRQVLAPIARKRVERLTAYDTVVQREFISSTYRNKSRPDTAPEILAAMIKRVAAKSPFEIDDIVIYEHGIKFVGNDKLDESIIERLNELIPPNGQIKVADTRIGTEVYLYLGSTPKVHAQTAASLKKNAQAISDVYDALTDYWDDVSDWYVWFETNESLYD